MTLYLLKYKWSTYSQGFPSEHNHFNEFDKANIKSRNYRCSIYLTQFDLLQFNDFQKYENE